MNPKEINPQIVRELIEAHKVKALVFNTHNRSGHYLLPRPRSWKTIEIIEHKEYQGMKFWVQSQAIYLDTASNSYSLQTIPNRVIDPFIQEAMDNLNDLIQGPVTDTQYYESLPDACYQVLQLILLVKETELFPEKVIDDYLAALDICAHTLNLKRESYDGVPVKLNSIQALDSRLLYHGSFSLNLIQ